MSAHRTPDRIVVVASLAALVMLAQGLAGKAIRDALFLSTFGVDLLPYAIAGAGVIALGSALPASGALARFGPARTVPWLFAIHAGTFTAEWLLIASAPRFVAGLLYLHLAAASALLISGFWANLNERFEPQHARRQLARVASFATLGGVIGGLISERASVWFGLDDTLLLLAGMNGLCALLVAGIGGSEDRADPADVGHAASPGASPSVPATESDGAAEPGAIGLLRRTPYLQWMAGASLLVAIVDALLDFAIRAAAEAAHPTGEELVRFFGLYYTGLGLATFVIQSVLSERMLGRFGIGPAMASLPVSIGLTGIAALWAPGLPSAVALRGAASASTNSVYRTGFELLYAPLPSRVKRPTKTLVDVGGQRIGDVLGAGLILLVLAALPAAALEGVTALAMLLSGAMVLVLVRLQAAYREQLARNLQLGVISLDELDAYARGVAETHVRLDRAEILASIHRRGVDVAAEPAADLATADVTALIDALGDPASAAAAAASLRTRGREATDALIAALASPAQPDLVKLLLPGLLEPIREPRVVEALLDALAQQGFEVRFQCVRAAARLIAAAPELAPTTARVQRALRDELANPAAAPGPESRSVAADRTESPLLEGHPQQKVGRRIEHVCTLLALDADRELMRSLLLGLHSESPAVRGTALEYLEVTLPEDVRRALPALLGPIAARPASRSARARRQVETELLRVAQHRVVPEGRD